MERDKVAQWFDQGFALMRGGAAPAGGLPAGGDMAVAKGMLAGPGSAAARAAMSKIREDFGGAVDPAAMTGSALDRYLKRIRDTPAVGVTTVASVALKKAGWTPDVGKGGNDPARFQNYLNVLATAPCMMPPSIETTEITYREKKYDQLIDEASKLLTASLGGDSDEIVKALTAIAKTAVTNVQKQQSVCIISQHAVAIDARTPGYYVYLTKATVTRTTKKSELLESSLVVYGMTIPFSVEAWTSGLYEPIGRRAYADAEDWFKGIDTPTPEGAPKLCFEP